MFTKGDIRRVNIVIPAERYSELIVKLGRSGLLHLDRGQASENSSLVNGLQKESLSSAAEVAAIIISAAEDYISEEGLLYESAFSGISIPDDIPSLFQRSVEEDLREVRRIASRKDKYEKAKAGIDKRIGVIEKKIDELHTISGYGIDLNTLNSLKYVSYFYGAVSSDCVLSGMKNSWFYIFEENRLLVIFPSSDRVDVQKMLNDNGFVEPAGMMQQWIPGETARQLLEKRLGLLRRRLDQLQSLYEKGEDRSLERLLYLAEVYRVIQKISGAESDLLSSDELIVISGWLNLEGAEPLRKLLSECCGESFYMRIATAKENRSFHGRIPVLLKNIKIFRPFELLVRMMGTPGNSEVDPTPAAAVAYTVIFGVMFGDLGQGLILGAAGFFLSKYGEKKHGERNSISDFGGIMIWCGLSAAFFGILYGSVFSYEHLIPALLFHPMENMMELFIMAIMAGVIFISAGLVFNIINGLMSGHYEEALFGTKGAAGLAVYLTVIYFVMRYIFDGVLPGLNLLAAVLLPPGILFAFRGPLGYLLFHGESIFPHGLFEYLVESMVEIIEMFSGFLGNTISFIRAGAFALSHAGLSIAVFTLAEIIDPSMKSAGAIAAIITGNLFIILLEGLVCSIQSMRLEYYEFFGKFFKGDGVAFAPFSLKFRYMKNGGVYE